MRLFVLQILSGALYIAQKPLKQVGKLTIFMVKLIFASFSRQFSFKLLGAQIIEIGYYSLPVIGMTALFTGAALAMQSYTGFERLHAASSIPIVIALSITRELAPVLCGLMMAGRAGSGVASEVATMKITEQIDALFTMNTDPIKYLVIPRVLAGVIVMPLLVLVADFIGIMGGYIVAVYKLHMVSSVYLKKTVNILQISDITSGLLKASVFGFVICLIACFNGINANKGAMGVGYAATNTVMASSAIILLCNYIITGMLFSI